MVVGGCDFGIFVGAGAGVCRLLGSFTLGDAVFMGLFLCINFTIVCAVYLWVIPMGLSFV